MTRKIEVQQALAAGVTGGVVVVPKDAGRITASIKVAAGTGHKIQYSTSPMSVVDLKVDMQGNPNLTFADTDPDTIVRSKGSWIDDGFVANMSLRVVSNLTAKGLNHEADFTLTSVAGISEVFTVTAKATSAYATTGEASHFFFNTPTTGYFVWFSISDAGTEVIPTTGVGSRTAIEAIVTAAADADAVAVILRSVIDGVSGLTTGGATDDCIVTVDAAGVAADAVDVDSTCTIVVDTQGEDAGGVGANTLTLLEAGVVVAEAGVAGYSVSGKLLGGSANFYDWATGDVTADATLFLDGAVTAVRGVNGAGGSIVAEFLSEF
jgi:hypothetical protein